jgi:predicted DNA-binding protein
MTNTERTTVTLSKIYMEMIDELVSVFGRTQAAVITNIVHHFFNNSSNFALLEELKARKRSKPDKNLIEEKIKKLFKGAKSIKLKDFLEYLNIDKNYLFNRLNEWKQKFNIELDYDKIKMG